MTHPRVLVLLAIATAAAFATPLSAAGGESTGLPGFYRSSGVNADGSSYEGIVQIADHGESVMLLWWPTPAAGASVKVIPLGAGIGIVEGHVLAASFYGTRGAGVVVYVIEAGGRLVGRWTVVEGDGTVYREVLTRMVAHPVPPTTDEHERDRTPSAPQPRPVKLLQARVP